MAQNSRLFLFNPENDIALASGLGNFTPPAAGRDMAASGMALPWWLGSRDDFVLVPDAADRQLLEWQRAVEERFGEGPRFVDSAANLPVGELVPWGWSAYTCRLFRKAGADPSLLSDREAQAESHREFSHRRTALNLLRELSGFTGGDDETSRRLTGAAEARSISEIESFSRLFPDFYVKAPWSSSGRGVFRSSELRMPQIEGILRRQGSVMLERAYDGVQDFAMLFMRDASGTHFHGYSMFFTGGTVYGGNLLASDKEIERRLSAMVGEEKLRSVRENVCSALEKLAAAPGYRGPLGVDMLVFRDGERLDVAPCIEVNCRYTMGFVAHALGVRGIRGMMQVAVDQDKRGILLSPPKGKHRFVIAE